MDFLFGITKKKKKKKQIYYIRERRKLDKVVKKTTRMDLASTRRTTTPPLSPAEKARVLIDSNDSASGKTSRFRTAVGWSARPRRAIRVSITGRLR
jgi:hypothetical protein